MSSKNLRLKACVCGVLAAAATNSAFAQERATVLEEIVVTAQKRQETLQEVPIAISAFTDKTRDLVGIQTVQDITTFAPGITYSTSLDRMSVRGIGRSTNNLAIDPSIATYGDGFYNSSNHQADATPLFVERVEVLRGPQGTLYGRNSIGGALNVILKRPTDELSGEARIDIGNYQLGVLEGTISGPVTDWMRVKVGANSTHQGKGFVKNLSGEDEWGTKNNRYYEAQISMNFGDAVDIWAKATRSDWDEGYGGSFGVSAAPYASNLTCSPAPCAVSLILPAGLYPNAQYNTGTGRNPAVPQFTRTNPRTDNPRQVDHNTPAHDTLDDNHIFVLEVIGHLGFADLKYVGGYQNYLYTLLVDWDNTSRDRYTFQPNTLPGPFTPPAASISADVVGRYIEDKAYFSNELNLISTHDGSLQYVVGLYQYEEDYHQPFDIYVNNQPNLTAPCRIPNGTFTGCVQLAAPDPTSSIYLTDQVTNVRSLAGFTQLDWRFVDTWKATLGVRYTKDRKQSQEYTRLTYWDPTTLGALFPVLDITGGLSGGVCPPASFNAVCNIGGIELPDGRWTRALEVESDAVTGTAGIEWSPAQGSLGYAKYTRGYKAAGINAGAIVPQPYMEEELVDAFEIGWKQEFDSGFVINTSAFLYDYQGAQIPLSIPQSSGPNITNFFNLDMMNYGVEIETTWQATDNLRFLLNYAYLHTELDDPDNGVTGCYPDALDNVIAGVALNPGPRPCTVNVRDSVGNIVGTRPGQAVDGNVAPGSPENKAAFNVLYSLNFDPGTLVLSGSYVWRDAVYSSIFQRDEWQVPSWGQADFRATWTNTDNDYSVIGYIRNAFDDYGYDGVGASVSQGVPTRTISYTNPRTYGVQLQVRFGAAAN